METHQFAVIAVTLFAFALVSRRLANTMITPPMVFVAAGLLLGGAGLGLVDLAISEHAIHTIAELTLALVLFTDAARIDLGQLRREHTLPQRMLVFGLPLTIALGMAVAYWLFPELGLWGAALLAAVLAPTDAALGQAVVTRGDVPVRIRQSINVESGLNDGIAVPAVVFFMCLASAAHDVAQVNWLSFAAQQILLGPVAGIAVGYVGGRLIDRTSQAGWMSEAFQGISALGLALIAFALADLIGGNGFIAAFVAGMVMGNVIRNLCSFLFEFAEAEGQLLTLFTFMIFGAAMVPEISGHVTLEVVLYAVLSLTVIRMLPIALSLLGAGLKLPTTLFLGWFGPRGLASILFALLVVADASIAAADEIMTITIVTVLISVFIHGLTAVPFAKMYARYVSADRHPEDQAEHEAVSEMPLRVSHRMPE